MRCIHRTDRDATAMMCDIVHPSVCLSKTSAHCGHTLHSCADLSLQLDSQMFFAP